jgi:hypothetical protein
MYRFLFLLLIITTAPSFAQQPSEKEPYLVETKDFKVIKFGIKEISLGITAVIYSPYKVNAKIQEVMIDVFVEDKKLGTILEYPDYVKVPKKDTFDLPLQIDVNTGATLTRFVTESARLAIGKSVKVNYKGYIKIVAMGFIPVKVRIDETEYFTREDLLGN